MLNFVLKFKIKHARTGKHYFLFYGDGKEANKFIIQMNREFNEDNRKISYHSQADVAGRIHNIEVVVY